MFKAVIEICRIYEKILNLISLKRYILYTKIQYLTKVILSFKEAFKFLADY